MTTDEITLEIKRVDEVLTSATVIMPTWQRIGDDGKIYIYLPLLGDLNTWAKDNEDVEIAIKEAFECFCLVAEKYGRGLEKELTHLGWVEEKEEKNPHISLLNFKTKRKVPAIDMIVRTGDTRALSYQKNTKNIMAYA